jgi:hypothetical protein
VSPETTRPAFAPWDERELPRIVTTEESARRLRTFHAIEVRLAKALDAWSAIIDEPHAKSTLARHAKHHDWHKSLFHHALADADGSSTDDAPIEDADVAAFVDAVLEPKDASQTIEFLTGVYRVLIPRKISAYTYYVRSLGGDANDADSRWFDLILKDEFDSVRDGELLLQSLLTGDADVQRSADRRVVLESLILKAGGIVGPTTLGGPATKEATA